MLFRRKFRRKCIYWVIFSFPQGIFNKKYWNIKNKRGKGDSPEPVLRKEE